MSRDDLRFWGGVMMGVGIASPYWPFKFVGFGLAAAFAFAILRRAR